MKRLSITQRVVTGISLVAMSTPAFAGNEKLDALKAGFNVAKEAAQVGFDVAKETTKAGVKKAVEIVKENPYIAGGAATAVLGGAVLYKKLRGNKVDADTVELERMARVFEIAGDNAFGETVIATDVQTSDDDILLIENGPSVDETVVEVVENSVDKPVAKSVKKQNDNKSDAKPVKKQTAKKKTEKRSVKKTGCTSGACRVKKANKPKQTSTSTCSKKSDVNKQGAQKKSSCKNVCKKSCGGLCPSMKKYIASCPGDATPRRKK